MYNQYLVWLLLVPLIFSLLASTWKFAAVRISPTSIRTCGCRIMSNLFGGEGVIIIGVIVSAIPGAFMEELGWRRFALPILQIKNNALIASIILGLIWGIWHIPSMIFFGGTNALSIIWAVVHFIPVTILFTWLFNNTQGSLLLVTLFHASQQYSNNFLGTIPSGTADIITWLVAIVVLMITGANNLSKTSERIKSE